MRIIFVAVCQILLLLLNLGFPSCTFCINLSLYFRRNGFILVRIIKQRLGDDIFVFGLEIRFAFERVVVGKIRHHTEKAERPRRKIPLTQPMCNLLNKA